MHGESTPQELYNASIHLSLSSILKKLQSNYIHHHKICIKFFDQLVLLVCDRVDRSAHSM